MEKKSKTLAFIDASNIIYGTRDESWSVNFINLYKYLKERYNCSDIFYFGGLDKNNLKQVDFYNLLKNFGYILILRSIKIFINKNGIIKKKANCDVDICFYSMCSLKEFDRVIFFSGDGDFDVLLKYFIEINKEVIVFANSKRTAKEIKMIEKLKFNDLNSIKNIIRR